MPGQEMFCPLPRSWPGVKICSLAAGMNSKPLAQAAAWGENLRPSWRPGHQILGPRARQQLWGKICGLFHGLGIKSLAQVKIVKA